MSSRAMLPSPSSLLPKALGTTVAALLLTRKSKRALRLSLIEVQRGHTQPVQPVFLLIPSFAPAFFAIDWECSCRLGLLGVSRDHATPRRGSTTSAVPAIDQRGSAAAKSWSIIRLCHPPQPQCGALCPALLSVPFS